MCDMHCCCFPLIFKEATQEKCICGHYEFVAGLFKRVEAAEAQVATAREEADVFTAEAVRLLGCLQHIYDTAADASLKAYVETAITSDEWPADLLAAVQILNGATSDYSHVAFIGARATLTRYGLLKEAR